MRTHHNPQRDIEEDEISIFGANGKTQHSEAIASSLPTGAVLVSHDTNSFCQKISSVAAGNDSFRVENAAKAAGLLNVASLNPNILCVDFI